MSDHANAVARHFSEAWKQYDLQIRQTVPRYDDALELLVAVSGRTCPAPRTILELGVGTGNLAALLLAAFPDAHLTGIDLVPDFLGVAHDRLSRFGDRVRLVEADVAAFDFGTGVDVAVTSFVLHHTGDTVKRAVYERVHACLNGDGFFANIDFVDATTACCSGIFDDLRVGYMRQAGLTNERIETEYVEHRKLERPTPIAVQLEWLRDIGFTDVECFWKYLNLAGMCARKSAD
jgi:tRNA (cmo5U34)-methyltransferase